MVTPRLAKNYPSHYAGLFRDTLKASITIVCSTVKEATRYRNALYAYRTALLDDPSVAPDVALIAPNISFSILGTALCITLRKTLKRSNPSNPGKQQHDPASTDLPSSSRLLDADDL